LGNSNWKRMGKEIEQRFFNFNKEEVLKKMKSMGAQYKGTQIFKVWKFNTSKNMNPDIHTLRVRDEGHRKTFTIKKRGGKEKFDTEWEVNIQDPQEMIKMLDLMEFDLDHYYEKVREIYKLGKSEIIFDTYPGMTYSMEIESPTLSTLNRLSKKLKVKADENDKSIDTSFYDYYGIRGGFDERIQKGSQNGGYTFQNVLKNSNKLATKNKKEFKSYLKQQLKLYNQINK
jgi:predicted adenylyl cyclase CyaB